MLRVGSFLDRTDAGRRLAEALEGFRDADPVILGLPRGGVPVAHAVAERLEAPLDVVLVRKIGAPFQPEYGIGAIAEGDVRYIRPGELDRAGITEEQVDAVVARESNELERRRALYRGQRAPVSVEGRVAILVDDGIATGGTAIAAARSLRKRGAASVVLAVPVAPPGIEERLADEFDEVIVLAEPDAFFAIGQHYVDFGQVGDEEVIALLGAGRAAPAPPALADPVVETAVEIEAEPAIRLTGDLRMPDEPAGLVIFAHGSGSSRLSPRNREVAEALNERGLATLLFDLLTDAEALDRANVFDIELLAHRLLAATRWAGGHPQLRPLPLGYFGASTGAAAALCAAADVGAGIRAVVSRGGRPDLAAHRLGEVVSPTLLIVGGADWQVLELNNEAASMIRGQRELAVVPGATHLFEEPGALERVSQLAGNWFVRHFTVAPIKS